MLTTFNIQKFPQFKIKYGELSRDDIVAQLKNAGIMLNPFANILLESEYFKTSGSGKTVQLVELSLKELGFYTGAKLSEINNCLLNLGLLGCSLELAPYIRLHYRSQKKVSNDDMKIDNQSPIGAITIFSEPLSADDEFPKGFYIRNTDGVLWLRGYRCSNNHQWSPDDRFLFKTA